MRVKFWGTRGLIPAPGPKTVRYGGSTVCVEVRTADGTLLILDCGTGIRELGETLADEGPVEGHILLSHTHWDHIQGLPFFGPAFASGNRFTIYAAQDQEKRLEDALAGQQEYTYFPVQLGHFVARMEFQEIVGPSLRIGPIRIALHALHHSEPSAGYRIEVDGRALVYTSDHELYAPLLQPVAAGRRAGSDKSLPGAETPGDRALVRFARGADLLIMDAQYSPEEYAQRIGWGHSTIEYATDVAIAAGAKRLALFHHDPSHTDELLDAFVTQCQARADAAGAALEIFAARERQELAL
jgi:phosphoribosyl 1,2-cyclic phosphodiesterase